MTKFICPICLNNINIFYYKSKCKCNIKYHYTCINDWYKINNICVYCKKKDNTNINNIINTYLESFIKIFTIIFIIIIIILYIYYGTKSKL
jgi:hypothetical protein